MDIFLKLFEAVSEQRGSRRDIMRRRKKWDLASGIEVIVSNKPDIWQNPNNLYVWSYESGWMPATSAGYLKTGVEVKYNGRGRAYEILKIRKRA